MIGYEPWRRKPRKEVIRVPYGVETMMENELSMYRRGDEKVQYRDGVEAVHFLASQKAKKIGFSAQNGSAEVEDSCSRAEHVEAFEATRGLPLSFPNN